MMLLMGEANVRIGHAKLHKDLRRTKLFPALPDTYLVLIFFYQALWGIKKMKRETLAAIPLLLFISDWPAAQAAELRVTGTILPAVCAANLSSGALYEGAPDRLDEKVAIACGLPTRIVLRAIDNRLESRRLAFQDNGAPDMGMGSQAAGHKLARISFTVTSAQVEIDGRQGQLLLSDDKGATWRAYDGTYWFVHPSYRLSWHNAKDLTPAAFTNLSMRLWANVSAPVHTRDSSQDIKQGGSITLEMIYL